MKPDVFLDSIGAGILVAGTMLPVSCLPAPQQENLQPFVAAAGAYSLQEKRPEKGVCSTCGAKVPPGGGRLGDGRVFVPCPECGKK